ncbi:MAG: sigma 54-interacting transcriptional regulator [Myxococcales bacterium]|nr:sigma 54-interacting transcriptional regulator [Polyangiaceae bacterium]MDW8249749.1 sigma 54-interacting transcriptional regulator [Myxococcales bacterium]
MRQIFPGGAGAATTPQFSGRVAAPRIEVTLEREAGKPADRVTVLDQELVRIGSHPSNEIVVNDPLVSRFHFRLVRASDAWRLTDTGSLNGVRMGGVRVRDADLPSSECCVEIGGSLLRIRELPSMGTVEVLQTPNFGALYGKSLAMQKLFATLERVSKADVNVLIEGESGTGKELVASQIARRSSRADGPFVVVDCSAITRPLMESELFGHVKGAFTGAERDRVGAFEAANGGIVFLDEIGELPLDMQPKLLRVLEAREIRRLGETKTRKVDVRILAATNRKLEEEVNRGTFREDLYFRLSVVTIRVPPLRERSEDIDLLIRVFLDSFNAQESIHLFTPEVLETLTRHSWPGNVRELRNYVERSVVFDTAAPPWREPTAVPSQPPSTEEIDLEVPFKIAKERIIDDFERRYLGAILDKTGGNLSSAARKAGIDRMYLHRLIQKLGLRPPRSLKD